jgi:acyl-coenzyme A thioesterase PaaI-like protein
MEPNTHHGIDHSLCGAPTKLEPGHATVTLQTLPTMAADAVGLVHGGFIFGLADYAAMLAVNDPNVVLGAADTRFLAPVRVGQTVVATASVQVEKGRKRTVLVECRSKQTTVMTGTFTCFVLDAHVLNGREA